MKQYNKVKVFLVISALMFSVEVFSQTKLVLPSSPNMKSNLVHTYTVVGPKSQTYSARKLKNLSYEEAKYEALAVDVVDGIEDLPDIVFVIDDSTTEASALIKAAHQINAIVVPLAPNDMMDPEKSAADVGLKKIKKESYQDQVKMIAHLLRFIYFSGERPKDYLVFDPKADRYGVFRAPSVIGTSTGALLAVAEGQHDSQNDFSPIDIVCKSSRDGGATWSSIKVAVKSIAGRMLVNPTLVRLDGKNHVAMTYNELPARETSGALKSGQTNRILTYICFSDSDGKSWSKPLDITAQVKLPSVSSYRVGAGLGICVSGGVNNGRLMIPCWTYSPGNWYNYVIYSDDDGGNWKIASGHSAYGIGESQIVQISETEFLINAVSRRGVNDQNFNIPKGWNPQNFERTTRNRVQMVVSMNDSVAMWSAPDIRIEQPDAICQGSIIRYSNFATGADSILLASNAASKHSWPEKNEPYMLAPPIRVNGTVRVSFDNGKTWGIANRIYGNRFSAFQNSGLVRLPKDQIGCIFDTNNGIKFSTFDLDWLLGIDPQEKKFKHEYY